MHSHQAVLLSVVIARKLMHLIHLCDISKALADLAERLKQGVGQFEIWSKDLLWRKYHS